MAQPPTPIPQSNPPSYKLHVYNKTLWNLLPAEPGTGTAGTICLYSDMQQVKNGLVPLIWKIVDSTPKAPKTPEHVDKVFEWNIEWDLFFAAGVKADAGPFSKISTKNPCDYRVGTTYDLVSGALTDRRTDRIGGGSVHIDTSQGASSGSVGLALNSDPWLAKDANPNMIYSFLAPYVPTYMLTFVPTTDGAVTATAGLPATKLNADDPLLVSVEVDFPLGSYEAWVILDNIDPMVPDKLYFTTPSYWAAPPFYPVPGEPAPPPKPA